MEAHGWLSDARLSPDHPLIDVSQAAPSAPPPRALREAIAEAALNDPGAHGYGPDLGFGPLRAALAEERSEKYGGTVQESQVGITSGCNQAFAAIMSTITGPEDEVLLPTPWYFNHKMWLDMCGVTAVPPPTNAQLIPEADTARGLITPKTRAIVLVTPNNPTGVEYPAETIADFFDLARENGLALILDETYSDFDSRPGQPHDIFTDPDWPETLIHLYSFSKAYRLTGHRVGAMIASERRLAEAEKFIDCVTICPNQIGQRAALWGLTNLKQWLAGERAEILARRADIEAGFADLPGWALRGCGAFFAYVGYPSDMPSHEFAKYLLENSGVLALPGAMFAPKDDPLGARHLRLAFANLDRPGIVQLFKRLREVNA